jgi:serine/threonine-protein kinase
MAFNASQLLELSTLVDELQALPLEDRAAKLATLSAEQAVFRPVLVQLLAQETDVEAADFLWTLPKLNESVQAQPSDLAAGADVGPYRLIREIGHGGMGTVWLAERSDGVLKRAVALKLPHSALPQRQLAERFARERDILAALTHPNIARLYDAGVTAQGQPYLALEYVEGEPLLVSCDRRKLGLRERIALYLQVLAAVQYAHGQLVVHRDLKPSNILVTQAGEVKLLDFGIAKLLTDGQAIETELTQLGGRALTLQYASPEQITGQGIGTASDVYTLGVVLYELLTGVLPYRVKRDSRGALEDAVLTMEPTRPSLVADDMAAAEARALSVARLTAQLKGDLDTILLKTLKKRPEDRYATVDALGADLRHYLFNEPVTARPDSVWYRARKFTSRHRLPVGAAIAVMLALGVGFGVALWQAGVAREQATLAREEARTSKAIHDFLADIFTANSSNQSDPLKARQTSARELLDIGAAKIDSSLKDAPEARAAVLRLVSDMYSELGLNERAAQLAEQRVDLLRSLRGADHPDVAEQLVEVSRMNQSTNRAGESAALLGEALRILELQPGQDHLTRMGVLRQLALLEQSTRNPKALGHAKQAVALAEGVQPRGPLIDALIVLGKVQASWDDNAAAETTLLRAVALLPEVPEFHRRQRVLLLAYLGDAQFELGKSAAAEKVFRESLDLAFKLSGPEHIDGAQMEFRLGQVLFDSGRTAEGLALLESAHARVVRVRGANNTSFLPSVIRVESAMQAELGDLELALRYVEQGLALSGVHSKNLNVVRLLLQQAAVMIELGRTADAKRVMEQLDMQQRQGVALTKEEHELYQLLAARLLLADHRLAEASSLLAKVRPRMDDERHSFVEWTQLLQWGELALDLGDAPLAGQIARRTLKQIAADPTPQYLALREQRAMALAGRVDLVLGNSAAAITALQRAIVLAETHLDPKRSPRLANALMALAQAFQQNGQSVAARVARARAQAIFATHPGMAAARTSL